MPRSLAARLLEWYALHGRSLPWRGTRNPYRIWVAEIMLQQTQVETVKPYYHRWLKRFPTLRALAAASEREVLAVWEGLGYYSRARNLHRAAQIVVQDYSGQMPRTVEGLRALPGIGSYTAAAIASIAFGVDAAVLDGNVKRVLARVFDFREDVKSPRGEKQLWALAQSLVPAGHAADYNQAVMDLGATVCTPRAPKCPACPLRRMCAARKLGVQLQRPVMKREPAAIPHHVLVAGVIHKGGRVLIVQRPSEALLGGLWAFPSGRRMGREPLAERLRRIVRGEWGLEVKVGVRRQTLAHAFTHFRITQHVFECEWQNGTVKRDSAIKWVRPSELKNYPMGKTDRQVAKGLIREA